MANESLPMETLLAYAAGELNAADRATVDAVLARDPVAADVVKLYQRACATMAGDDSIAPPAEATGRAKAIFVAPQRDGHSNWLDRAQQFIARLVFDSRTQPALAGIRSRSQSCLLVFETENESLDLQAEPRRDVDGRIILWQIVGQVEREPDASRCPVLMTRVADQWAAANSVLDERGVFSFDVAPGLYEIRIGLPNYTIVVPDLDLT